ncbi:release factor glutamine methyltransferase [Labedella gwakjiensis]|uniref:Release factor glutamine methyltransferase n=1 Tax=Labedella gwakjiensis TaxID=390269 RepID=A0A2P8GYA9_9MICO|nr:peptide chain release factor N(5)-glutamine methyltransferase [Labedella gwakjiensis]PSL38942.1 release factor glutamine methyltransferase [Labedella gwakjiensis]RUQ86596.1 peptide chain release factor N(5)-glutamine methyltransferase [Labedella gwakjiensis]
MDTPPEISLAAARAHAAARLAAAGIQTPEVDAELLIGHVVDLGRGELAAAMVVGKTLSARDAEHLEDLVARRAAREPLQHITGTAFFRSLRLAVGPGVFVPRPETELLVQYAIDELRALPEPSPIAVDLGTGSGAIALSMATEVPQSTVYAVENSVDAFVWARQNADSVGATNATVVFDDLAHALARLDGTVSLVVSNPPYVPDAAIPRDPEVRLHDPAHALYGGADGLDVVRDVSSTALRLLRPGGRVLIEHGELQGEAIRDLLAADGWSAPATFRDLTQRDRITSATR